MNKYNVISFVFDPKKNFCEGETRGRFATEEEARKHFPSIDEIKQSMKKELEHGARYDDTVCFGFNLVFQDDESGIPEEIEIHYVSFAEVR